MKKAVIILPTFNEKENIGRVITILETEVFPSITNYDMAILVADDSSPDGTEEVVRGLMKKYKNLEVNEGPKKGLGAAYVRGMTYAISHMGADVVFEMDSDLQHDPKKIPDFLKKIDEGYDIVVGTRYSGGGSIPKTWGFKRKAYSIIANLIVRFVFWRFDIHDWTGGYRALKKEVFLKEKEKLTAIVGYTFQVSSLHMAVRSGFTVAEVPFHFSDRTNGDSKIAPKEYIFNVLTYIFVARYHELERFIKFLFVGGTGFIVQVLFQEGAVKLGTPHPTAVAIGAETAIVSNFILNNFWTFSDTKQLKQKDPMLLRLIKFNITSFGAIIIQYFADFIAERIFGPTMHLGTFAEPTRIVILFPTIIFIVIPLNYVIYNKIIWKTQYLKNGQTKDK